ARPRHPDHEPARDRLELCDVAGPRIGAQALVRAGRDARLLAADLRGVVLDPAFAQGRQVLDAIAQRRDLDAVRGEQLVEVARDDLRLDRVIDIDVRGRDDLAL